MRADARDQMLSRTEVSISTIAASSSSFVMPRRGSMICISCLISFLSRDPFPSCSTPAHTKRSMPRAHYEPYPPLPAPTVCLRVSVQRDRPAAKEASRARRNSRGARRVTTHHIHLLKRLLQQRRIDHRRHLPLPSKTTPTPSPSPSLPLPSFRFTPPQRNAQRNGGERCHVTGHLGSTENSLGNIVRPVTVPDRLEFAALVLGASVLKLRGCSDPAVKLRYKRRGGHVSCRVSVPRPHGRHSKTQEYGTIKRRDVLKGKWQHTKTVLVPPGTIIVQSSAGMY
eukprot:COSAG02_NODE_309_length_25051_cov_5.385460_10_plen_283_part_00